MIFVKDATHAVKLVLDTGRTATDRANPIPMFSGCFFEHFLLCQRYQELGPMAIKIFLNSCPIESKEFC